MLPSFSAPEISAAQPRNILSFGLISAALPYHEVVTILDTTLMVTILGTTLMVTILGITLLTAGHR